jgi:hypothetical protein
MQPLAVQSVFAGRHPVVSGENVWLEGGVGCRTVELGEVVQTGRDGGGCVQGWSAVTLTSPAYLPASNSQLGASAFVRYTALHSVALPLEALLGLIDLNHLSRILARDRHVSGLQLRLPREICRPPRYSRL